MKELVKSELKGWKPFDVIWLGTATVIILILSLIWKDNTIGIICALTGIWCVILTGKGKLSSFLFGTVNTLLYAYVAFYAKYYGEVMLNLLYYFPTNIIGMIAWRRHFDYDTGEVSKTRLSLRSSLITYLITAVAIILYGLILKKLGGNQPFIDSMSTVISLVAQILLIRRYMEQWILWIVVDVVTVIMWAVNFAHGGGDIATLLMWIIYLVNAVIMFVRWYKGAKKA